MTGRTKSIPHEISIKHAKNGGFIVRHSFNNEGSGESYQPPEEHAFGNHAAMLAHVTKHTKQSPFATGAGSEPDADEAAGPTGPAPAKHGAALNTKAQMPLGRPRF